MKTIGTLTYGTGPTGAPVPIVTINGVTIPATEVHLHAGMSGTTVSVEFDAKWLDVVQSGHPDESARDAKAERERALLKEHAASGGTVEMYDDVFYRPGKWVTYWGSHFPTDKAFRIVQPSQAEETDNAKP